MCSFKIEIKGTQWRTLETNKMSNHTTHWLVQVSDMEGEKNRLYDQRSYHKFKLNGWSVSLRSKQSTPFAQEAVKGDVLWFVGYSGIIFAMAIYDHMTPSAGNTDLHFTHFDAFKLSSKYYGGYMLRVSGLKKGVVKKFSSKHYGCAEIPEVYQKKYAEPLRLEAERLNRERFNTFGFRSHLNDDVLRKIRSFV